MPAFDKRILGNIVRGGGVPSASCSAAGYQRGSFHHGGDPLFGVDYLYPEHTINQVGGLVSTHFFATTLACMRTLMGCSSLSSRG